MEGGCAHFWRSRLPPNVFCGTSGMEKKRRRHISLSLLRMRMYYAQREVAWACSCWKKGNKTPRNKKVKKPRLAAIPRFALTRNIERRMYVYTETQDKDPSCFPPPLGICMTNAGRSIPYFLKEKKGGSNSGPCLVSPYIHTYAVQYFS